MSKMEAGTYGYYGRPAVIIDGKVMWQAHGKNQSANATLFAAAPDLLTSLEGVINAILLDRIPLSDELKAKMLQGRIAVLKAKGEWK